MVYLTHKWKKGRKYLYLEKKARIEGKVKRIYQIYLGPEDKIEERQILLNIEKLDIETYSAGSAILWQVAQELQLGQIINQATGKKRNQGLTVGDYILVAIVNRCISPCSKNSIGKWISKDYLGILFQDATEKFKSQTYWNHFQYFTPELLEQIQREITNLVLRKFDVSLDCILYDPTNFVTHSGYHDEDHLAQFGNSKEKRRDKRIVNISLLCSKTEGIPLWHQTYRGNIHDSSHFNSAIKKITDFMTFLEYEIEELTLVFDKGNHSKEAISYLHDTSLHFITSIRKSSHKTKVQAPTIEFQFVSLKDTNRVGYMAYNSKFHGTPGILYVMYDRSVRKRSLAIFARDLRDRRQEIWKFIDERVNQHKWRDRKNVENKLKELCKGIPFRNIFQYEVTGEYGELEVNITENVEAKSKHCRQLGRSVIFTTREDWSPQTTIQYYRDKYIIEDSFKQMKDPTSIAIRPMYHHSKLSIHIHVFTCVMAYLLNTVTKLKLEDAGIGLTTKELRSCLKELKLTKVGGGQLKQPLLKLNTLRGESKKVAKKFNLDQLVKDLKE